MEKLNFDLDTKKVAKIFNAAKSSGEPFEYHISTYTAKIITAGCTYSFSKNKHSMKVFAAYNKILSDIKEFEANGGERPKFEQGSLKYFGHNIKAEGSYKNVHNYDIRAAYISALLKLGYIKKETYLYLMDQKKDIRLSCAGMLASNKDIFYYNEGKIIEKKNIRNIYADYFFAAVFEVNRTIDDFREALGEWFLFYWVDGIFLKEPVNVEEFTQLTKAFFDVYGYEVKYELCKFFKIKKEKDCFNLNYYKDGRSKRVSVPIGNKINTLKKELLQIQSLAY